MKILKGILRTVIFAVVSMAVPSVWAQAGAHTMVTPGDLKWLMFRHCRLGQRLPSLKAR